MGFRSSILAGKRLIREAIQSPNFATGSAGWEVRRDGSAEFNDIVIRGGTQQQGQVFVYNGTPAAGNLMLSISPAAGTDEFGNAYVAGEGLYGANGTLTALNSAGDTVRLRTDAPSYVSNNSSPGMELRPAGGTGLGASVTAYDDGFTRGMLLQSPTPDPDGQSDFSYVQMTGGFGEQSGMQLIADGPVWVQGTAFENDGVISAYAGGNFNTYTPAITGHGSATFTQRTGYWQRIGPIIVFVAYLTINGAGSGSGTVTITAPTDIDRTTRQVVPCHMQAVTTGNTGSGMAVAFQSGSGKVFDGIRSPTNGALMGSDLLSGGTIVIQGWYREASL